MSSLQDDYEDIAIRRKDEDELMIDTTEEKTDKALA
jgi:hypothetical protein